MFGYLDKLSSKIALPAGVVLGALATYGIFHLDDALQLPAGLLLLALATLLALSGRPVLK